MNKWTDITGLPIGPELIASQLKTIGKSEDEFLAFIGNGPRGYASSVLDSMAIKYIFLAEKKARDLSGIGK